MYNIRFRYLCKPEYPESCLHTQCNRYCQRFSRTHSYGYCFITLQQCSHRSDDADHCEKRHCQCRCRCLCLRRKQLHPCRKCFQQLTLYLEQQRNRFIHQRINPYPDLHPIHCRHCCRWCYYNAYCLCQCPMQRSCNRSHDSDHHAHADRERRS